MYNYFDVNTKWLFRPQSSCIHLFSLIQTPYSNNPTYGYIMNGDMEKSITVIILK